MVTGLPCLVIDHHSSGEPFGDARMVDSSAPSTTVLLLDLFEALAVAPDADTARLILFGLCTDTGFFRHLGAGSAETCRSIARLVERRHLHGGRLHDGVRQPRAGVPEAPAEMIEHAESHWSDRLIMTWQVIADRQRLGAHQRGEDDLYRLLQTVDGNVVVALIKEEAEGPFPSVFGRPPRSTSAPWPHPSAAGAIARRRASTSEALWNP